MMKLKLRRKLRLTLMLLLGAFVKISVAQTYTVSPNAQNWDCGLNQSVMGQLAGDTGFVNGFARYQNAINTPLNGNQVQSVGPYIVPVVFHVISTSSATTVMTYNQIKWQLSEINAAFNGQLQQFTGKAPGSRNVITTIEFRLACIAQNCGAPWSNTNEPGVMRYATTNSVVLNQSVLDPTTITPMLAITHSCTSGFSPANYLNIWCVPNITSSSGITVGYGTFPWMATSNPAAPINGVVMRIDAVGNNSYPTNFPLNSQFDKGAILAHEFGHYLGLFHTFETVVNSNVATAGATAGCFGQSTATNGKTDGDMILDTPPTFITSDLGSITNINSCKESNFPYGTPTSDQPDQLENYMSYSDDDKLNTFTAGQRDRMISTFTVTGSPRFNLNTVANLGATGTGIFPVNSCSNNTGLLTALFNYSIVPGSNCTNVNIQFTTPTSIGFTANQWNWSFGDGGVSSLSNPSHIYATSGGTLYNVTLTASDGTNTASYTQSVSINFNVSIVGQSGLNIPVCRGSEQTIYINFGVGVPSIQLTDGVNAPITVYNAMPLSFSLPTPYTFVANSTASYSIMPIGCGTGVANFNVIDCCNTLINNGDFSNGIFGYNTQLVTPFVISPYPYYGSYEIYDPSGPGLTPGIYNATGNAMNIDGFSGQNTNLTYSIVAGCPATTIPSTVIPRPIVWRQTITGLQPNTNYYYSMKFTENFNSGYGNCVLNFATSVYNNTLTLLPAQTMIPLRHPGLFGNPNAHRDFVVFTYTFATTNSVTPASSFSVEINQINNFDGGGWDYALDNIRLNQLTPSIQALGTKTICPGQTAALTTTTNCGQILSNYNVAWTPTVGLSCTTCTNPIASPSVTTTYTLVATPTSTVGGNPAITSNVIITVNPTFTVSPLSQFIYYGQSATLTATGSTGTYSWNPGALTGNTVVVAPNATTVYTVTNAASGTCSIGTPTVYVSYACSQAAAAVFGTSTVSAVNFPASTTAYTVANTVYDMQGTITFTGNTTFTGYSFRMAKGTKLVINKNVTVTFNNCKLYGCTELWYGIQVLGASDQVANINVTNGTTIEDMYFGIYRNADNVVGIQSSINITDSKLNKNYIGIQLLNMPAYNPVGSSYSLTVKNSTITTVSSITSPGNNLKPSTIPTYTYAYNQITGGAGGSTLSYTAFPRGYIGINLNNLSTTNNALIGDSAGVANTTFNTFSNLDFGIYAANAQLRVHNNYFYNLRGSTKQINTDIPNPTPMPVGPAEIGIAIAAQHTVANTYSLQVGSKDGPSTIAPALIYPKSNIFKTVNKGISAINCSVVITKCNLFDSDTTDVPNTDYMQPTAADNTYYYYRAQAAVWISSLSANASLNWNFIRNYRVGINLNQTIDAKNPANIKIGNNNIQALSPTGYCAQAINLEQMGGINAGLLEVSTNAITKVFNGINANAIYGGLNIHDHIGITLDNAKTYGKAFISSYSHTGIKLLNVQNAIVQNNTNINSNLTTAFTSRNCGLTNAVYVTTSPNNTITCNTINNVGRGFYFQGTCTSPNGWLGNGMSNSYRGLELNNSGAIGTQGTVPSGTLAANTWSNIVQETYVTSTTNANTGSNMFVGANSTYTTAPSLNYGTAGQIYIVAANMGIDVRTGTPFSCSTGGGTGGALVAMASMASVSSISTTTVSNTALYSTMASTSSTVYPTYTEELTYQSQQLLYKLQKQGKVSATANSQLQSFYTTNSTSNIGKFTDVELAIAANNKTLAQSKNNSIVPSNAVQQKTKRATELMLKHNINCNYQYSSTEWQDLLSMANECEVKGWYVAQARNIVNAISGALATYSNSCEPVLATARIANKEAQTATIIAEPIRSFNLFPNPNNGNMTMLYDLGKDSKGNMYLYDVTGKLISTYDLQNTNGTLEINENQLQNGIYFYRILVNGIIVNTSKIVIIK